MVERGLVSGCPAAGAYTVTQPFAEATTVDEHTRTVAIFAVVFFVLTLLSGAGFFGAIGVTVVATIVVHFGLRWWESRKAKRP